MKPAPVPVSTAAPSAPCARPGAGTAASSRWQPRPRVRVFGPACRCRPRWRRRRWLVGAGRGQHPGAAGAAPDRHPQAWDTPEGLGVARLAQRLGVATGTCAAFLKRRWACPPAIPTNPAPAAAWLLTDTRLPVTQVALSSGFGSVRRFNAAFATHRPQPQPIAPRGRASPGDAGLCGSIRLAYRPAGCASAAGLFCAAPVHRRGMRRPRQRHLAAHRAAAGRFPGADRLDGGTL